ncbi:MAG TPA: DUF2267 domain-containing protein [Balneolaceae bacterium]|nr:DUF2267 domain-containing protein [Balneolaceae bacterium]
MTMINEFKSVVSNSELWIKDAADALGTDDYRRALQAVRATLKTVRDRLPVDEAVNFGSQLPVLLSGYYYEGWKPANTPTKERSISEFYDSVQKHIDQLGHPLKAEDIVKPIFSVIASRISEGETHDLIQMMPNDFRELWPESVAS